MSEFSRPDLDPCQAKALTDIMRQGLAPKPHWELKNIAINLALENARLCLEVNQLRAMLGLAPLPVYQPRLKK